MHSARSVTRREFQVAGTAGNGGTDGTDGNKGTGGTDGEGGTDGIPGCADTGELSPAVARG